MRIIAGRLKGRRLKTPSWPGVRPTSDKLRETLFNILSTRVPGARVLDGFAGTGALGIEAISRGAASATFIDGDRRAVALTSENVAHCGIENVCVIIRAEVARVLDTLYAQTGFEPFDIVLLDPPYALASGEHLLPVLESAGRVLSETGILVVEHARRDELPTTVTGLTRSRDVRSGDSALTFYDVHRPPRA
jgi:16S rRNA (guanine966-N2)-methyltransferase